MEYPIKKSDRISNQDLDSLNQIVLSLEQAEEKLEYSYNKKKPEQFNAIKQFILKLNKKITEIV